MGIQGTRILGVLLAGIVLASCDAFKDADLVMPAVTANTWPDGAQTLIIDATDVPGYELETVTLSYSIDGTLPVASLNPAAGADLLDDQPVEISFSESMNPDSLTGSGSLWDESAGPASRTWSTVTHTNDRLTISPDATWTLGAQTLVMDLNDMAGNAMTSVNVSYNAITSIIVNCDEQDDDDCELRLGEVCLRDAQCFAGICKNNLCSLSRNQCTDFLDRPLPQGTPCDDGDPETVNDQCNGMSMCIGTQP